VASPLTTLKGAIVEERTPDDVLQLIGDEGIEIVDVRFCDLPGLMQHFSMPAGQLTAEVFDEGVGFDGSSIRGFQEIQESDMLLVPDPNTAVVDPFTQHKTLNLNCFVNDPVTGESYSRDPRYVARKAEEYLTSTGLADTCYMGPEAEFFVFDDVRFDQNEHEGYYFVESVEAAWNTGRDENPNLGYKPRYKEGYFPVPPMDHFQDLRSEMILVLERLGVEIEIHHHEVGTAGQAEIDCAWPTSSCSTSTWSRTWRVRRGRRPRSCPSRCSRTTVRACTPTSRSGRAASRCSTARPATPGSATWAAGTSAGC
jgi:glutamine synthetase